MLACKQRRISSRRLSCILSCMLILFYNDTRVIKCTVEYNEKNLISPFPYQNPLNCMCLRMVKLVFVQET